MTTLAAAVDALAAVVERLNVETFLEAGGDRVCTGRIQRRDSYASIAEQLAVVRATLASLQAD